ncbi:MAG: succinate dehydrogenase membrane anchor subunit [Planctomycetota bacterium]
MSDRVVPLPQRGFGRTSRTDAWWLQPLSVVLVLGAFLVYANIRVFQGSHYHYEGQGAHYLSPFYSPELWGESIHAWFGPKPAWWPGWLFFSPAALILWAPAGFRLTCYYYRGAYYKGFWADPPACAVGEPRKTYWGERTLPLILQNLHRYFLYVALIFLLILAWDAWSALWFIKPDGSKTLGIGVGTIVLTLNVVFLGAYTLGCHSLRHLVGGYRDTMSDRQRKCYECVSSLNQRHMLFAWISLFWVAFSDLYIYMLSTGAWSDLRIL